MRYEPAANSLPCRRPGNWPHVNKNAGKGKAEPGQKQSKQSNQSQEDESHRSCHTATVLPLPPSSSKPFVVDVPAGTPVRGSALLLHGYTGTPFEVLTTAHTLAARGFVSHGPLLRGHGSDPVLLNQVRWRQWLDDVTAAFDALPAHAPRIVVGCSMGGLLALHLSLARSIDALILLAPALRLHPKGYLGVAAVFAGLWKLRPLSPKEAPGGDVGAKDAQDCNPTYKVLPTRGLIELCRLQFATEAVLAQVSAPLCVLHGALDQTIAPSSATVIAQTVASPLVEHHRLMNTQHLVGLDRQRDLANALVADFVDDVVRPAQRRGSNPPSVCVPALSQGNAS